MIPSGRSLRKRKIGNLAFLLILTAILSCLPGLQSANLLAAEYHVRPDGSPSGNGSRSRPWDLATALSQPRAVRPGDILWLHGGTYRGAFRSKLTGTLQKPIVVRQAPGEKAVIDGGDSHGDFLLYVGGAYAWYWGFEVTSSDPNRVSGQTGSWPSDIGRGEAIFTVQEDAGAKGCKFINLVVHDARQGFSFWKEAVDAELYGCLIYHNGWCAPDRTHGHGIYSQNETGTKRIVDNIVLDDFNHGIQIYGSSSAALNNYVIEGNVIAGHPKERNVLIGGGRQVQNLVFKNNFVFDKLDAVAVDIGWNPRDGAGAKDVVFEQNYLVGRTQLWDVSNGTVSGNTFIGHVDGIRSSQYPGNNYLDSPPSANAVFVRPNAYEAGRANVIVYNWEGKSTVDVDLGAVLHSGERFTVRDAQNYGADPVVSGTYNGAVRIPIPAHGTAMRAEPPCHPPFLSGKSFGVFIVERTGPPAKLVRPSAPKKKH